MFPSPWFLRQPYEPSSDERGRRSNASHDVQNGEVMQAGGKARNTMVVGVDEAAGELP